MPEKHHQAIFRFNQWTPLVGTKDFNPYQDTLLVDPRLDPKGFRKFDTMHNVVDPKKMYNKMNIPEEKRWVKEVDDWMILRNEILKEYLESPEYFAFLETLKEKVSLGKKGLLHKIAIDFRADILSKI